MNAIRTFIAIELPPQVQQNLGGVISRLKGPQTSIVRWVAAHNIHLTLKFLGDVSPANMDHLQKILQAQVSQQPRFAFTVEGMGAFPSLHRPRVIWAGISAPPQLAALAHVIDFETVRLGYPSEDRPFSPHLTFGRLAQHATPEQVHLVADILAESMVGKLGSVEVTEVTLFKSDLQPGGAVYSPLLKIGLRL